MDPNTTPAPEQTPINPEPVGPPATVDPISTGTPGVVVVGGDTPPASQPLNSDPIAPNAPAVAPIVGGAPNQPLQPKSSRFNFHPSKKALTVVAAVVVLAGASAAAYEGVIVPNKPANVVRSALFNTIQAKQSSFKANIEGSSVSGGSTAAYKVELDGAQDAVAKAADVQLNITFSGVSFPIEARYVDKNIYVKVGDLSTLASLANAYSPDLGSLAQSVSGKLSNQWIVIDSTLVRQANLDCFLDSSMTLAKGDQKILGQVYAKHPFAIVKAAGSDTVNGHKVAKYTVTIDDDKAAAYGNSQDLDNLSLAKSLTKCDKSISSKNNSDFKGDHKKTVLTVWVDKASKRLAKVGYTLNSGSEKGSISGTFEYGKLNITAPSGAKPAVQVLADLQASLGGADSGFDLASLFPGGQDKAKDTKRQTDILSIQTKLEAYWADHNGSYPSFAQLNDANWRKANLQGYDDAGTKDPDGNGATFAQKPAAHVYAYQPTTAGGGSCEADASKCVKYTLTATLSDGTSYQKSSLNTD